MDFDDLVGSGVCPMIQKKDEEDATHSDDDAPFLVRIHQNKMLTPLLPVYRKTKNDLPNLPERILDGRRRRPQPALPPVFQRLFDVGPRHCFDQRF